MKIIIFFAAIFALIAIATIVVQKTRWIKFDDYVEFCISIAVIAITVLMILLWG